METLLWKQIIKFLLSQQNIIYNNNYKSTGTLIKRVHISMSR